MPKYFQNGFFNISTLLLILAVGTLSVIYGTQYFTIQEKISNAGRVLAGMVTRPAVDDIANVQKERKPNTCGTDGLYAHFDFENVSGSTVPDLSGCNNNGTLGDSGNGSIDPLIVSSGCKVGSDCVQFDGKDDYMSMPAPLAVTPGNNNDPIHDFTWSFWIYPIASRTPGEGCNNHGNSQYCSAFIHRDAYGPNRQVGFLSDVYPSTSRLKVRWNNVDSLESVDLLMPNMWHHIALTRYEDYYPPWQEYAHQRLYIDGVKVDEDVFLHDPGFWDRYASPTDGYGGTYIGGDGYEYTPGLYGWAGYVKAYMDDVKVYNRYLTKEEVCHEYVCAPGGVSGGSCINPGNPDIQVTCQ